MLKQKNRACGAAAAVFLCAGALLLAAGCSGGGARAGAMGLWSQEAAGQPERVKGGSVPIRLVAPPPDAVAGQIVRVKVVIEPNVRRTAYRVIVNDPSEVVESSPDTILVAKGVEAFEVMFKICDVVPDEARVHFLLTTMDGLGEDKTQHSLTVKGPDNTARNNAAAAAAVVAAAAPMQPEVSGRKGGSVPISNCPEKDKVVIHAAAGETLLLRVNLQGSTLAGQEFAIEADPPGAGKLFNMPEKVIGVVGDTWIEVPVRIEPGATGDAVLKVTGNQKTVKYILKLK